MDLRIRFIEMHTTDFVESRIASASTYRYGNGSPVATIIGAIAARIRRGAGSIEAWARGSNAHVIEDRLPRMHSAR